MMFRRLARTRNPARWCLALLILGGSLSWSHAHAPKLSSVAVRAGTNALDVVATYSRLELESLVTIDRNQDGRLTTNEIAAASSNLVALARRAFTCDVAGQALAPESVTARYDESDAIVMDLRFPPVTGGILAIHSDLLAELMKDHRQEASVVDATGRTLTAQVLTPERDFLDVPLGGATGVAAPPPSWTSWFVLGVEHLVTGWDHLAFLFGLLVVGGSWREALKIITSFTVAHSLTLALTALQWIHLPSRFVEAVIAGSILFVGVENLVHRNLRWRWMLTFAFGLIHGCGFASALADAGLGRNGQGIVGPLLAFNLGLESAQLALAALILPGIWWLHRRPRASRIGVPALSVAVGLTGLVVLIQRIWG